MHKGHLSFDRPAVEAWAEKIRAGDRRSIARAISAIESGAEASVPLLKCLFPSAHRAETIGVTGSPGAGKSTLVEKLAMGYRARALRVGILAVDPTSPFSTGAILGDRVRMQRLATDGGVYIRSMATRGHLGGLAAAAYDAVTVLAAGGSNITLIETVGVGQDEVEIATLADTTVLLLVPGMGDSVQTLKAGVMEIADVFVINKADRGEAGRLEQEINSMLVLAPRQDGWKPPVLKVVSTTGEGVDGVLRSLDEFRSFAGQSHLRAGRDKEKWRERLLKMVQDSLFSRFVQPRLKAGMIDSMAVEIARGDRDPYSVVEDIIKDFPLNHWVSNSLKKPSH